MVICKLRHAKERKIIRKAEFGASVRGICCDWSDDYAWFRLRFYLDKEPNEIERELLSIVLTEFECDIQDFKKIFENCIFLYKIITK